MAEKKKTSPIVLFGGAAIILTPILFKLTEPPAPVKKAPKLTRPVSSSSKKKDIYTPEDYKASFVHVSANLRNAFEPGVAKENPINSTTQLSENGIPPAFAGGETTWIYTGNAEVDGVANALLENTANGESVFLRKAEKWRNLTLIEVAGERITVEGPGGLTRTLKMPMDGTVAEQPGAVITPLPPLNPGQLPGQLPGQVPGQAPGQTPGQPLRGGIANQPNSAMAGGASPMFNPNAGMNAGAMGMQGQPQQFDNGGRRGRRQRNN